MASILTKAYLQEMQEDELQSEVLIPLLKAMGYQDVFEHHGGDTEQGKDIVCWRQNDLGGRENLAIVAKAVKITGKASLSRGSASEVQMQIQQCFGVSYLDPINGENQLVHQCWVVSNKKINKQSEESIISALSRFGMDRNVKFIDINKLWELVERYMPVKAVMQKLGEVNKVFNNLDTHFRPTAILNNQGISLGIAEKFPGASREKPFNIGMTFNFPNTEEGQLAKSAFERSFATGVPVDIRSPYIKSIEFPESFSQLLGKEAIPSSIHIESINNQIYLLARMEFISDDGDRFVLDYVHFTVAQSGTEESTLTNENQPTPIQIKLILFLKQQRASIQFHFQADQVNVHQILDAVNLFNIASKPMTVKITDLNTGIIMFTQHYDKGVCGSPDSALVEMFKDLNEIQIKLQRPIFYPNRQLTSEEENTIGLLRTIFHERGKVTTGWEAITISLTQEGAKHSVEKFKDGKTDYVKLTGQEMITLFGIDLPLGETEVIIENACLRNEDEVLTRLTQAISENEVIDCEFIPMNGSAIRKQYLNWQ